MKKYHIKLTGGIALGGQVKRPGEVIEVDEKFARQLLHRGKGELVDGEHSAEPVTNWNSLTIPELRALLPDAPARANKAALVALAEAAAAAEAEAQGDGDDEMDGGTDGA